MYRELKQLFLDNFCQIVLVCTVAAVAIMASGCAVNEPIGAKYAPTTNTGKLVAVDLVATLHNMDAAVQVGALSADDPAPGCIRAAVNRLGLEQETFEPEVNGLISAASVAYIKARQIENRAPVSLDCKALVGDILLRRLGP